MVGRFSDGEDVVDASADGAAEKVDGKRDTPCDEAGLGSWSTMAC